MVRMTHSEALEALRFAGESAGPEYEVYADRLPDLDCYRIRWVKGDQGMLCTLSEADVLSMGLAELAQYVARSYARLTRTDHG